MVKSSTKCVIYFIDCDIYHQMAPLWIIVDKTVDKKCIGNFLLKFIRLSFAFLNEDVFQDLCFNLTSWLQNILGYSQCHPSVMITSLIDVTLMIDNKVMLDVKA